MSFLKKLMRTIDAISQTVGKADAWLIVFLTVIVLWEVVTRRFFGAPTVWTFETSNQLFGAYFMLGAPFALLHGAHVSVDVIYHHLSERKKAILDVISYLVFYFPFCIILIWQGEIFAATAWQMKETSQSVFAPPLYPIKTVIPVTGVLLLLQGLVVFVKRCHYAAKGREMS